MQNHPIVEQPCFKNMYEVVEKYRKQSLDEKFLFRAKLESKDIINCEEIKDINTEAGLNNFALSMCYQAQAQKQKKDEKKAETEQEKKAEETQAKQTPLETIEIQADPVSLGANTRRPFIFFFSSFCFFLP